MSCILKITNIYNNNVYTVNYNKIILKDVFDKIKLFDNYSNSNLNKSNIMLIDENNKLLSYDDIIDEKYNNKTLLFYYNNFVNSTSDNLNTNYNNNLSVNIINRFMEELYNTMLNNNNILINNINNNEEKNNNNNNDIDIDIEDEDNEEEDLTDIIQTIKNVIGDMVTDDIIKDIYLYDSNRNIEVTINNILNL